jgi:hypothetical protein
VEARLGLGYICPFFSKSYYMIHVDFGIDP